MEPFELWYVERVDNGECALVEDGDDVEDYVQAILDDGGDCRVKVVTVH